MTVKHWDKDKDGYPKHTSSYDYKTLGHQVTQSNYTAGGSWTTHKSCYHAPKAVQIGDTKIYACARRTISPAVLAYFDIVSPLIDSSDPAFFSYTGFLLWFPIRDFTAPHPQRLRAHCERLIEFARKGARILTFCEGSHGRTGTVLAGCIALAEPDLDPVATVRERHCKQAVEKTEQVEAIFHSVGKPVPGTYKPGKERHDTVYSKPAFPASLSPNKNFGAYTNLYNHKTEKDWESKQLTEPTEGVPAAQFVREALGVDVPETTPRDMQDVPETSPAGVMDAAWHDDIELLRRVQAADGTTSIVPSEIEPGAEEASAMPVVSASVFSGKASEEDLEVALARGERAVFVGLTPEDNPYDEIEQEEESDSWLQGFSDAFDTLIGEGGEPALGGLASENSTDAINVAVEDAAQTDTDVDDDEDEDPIEENALSSSKGNDKGVGRVAPSTFPFPEMWTPNERKRFRGATNKRDAKGYLICPICKGIIVNPKYALMVKTRVGWRTEEGRTYQPRIRWARHRNCNGAPAVSTLSYAKCFATAEEAIDHAHKLSQANDSK